MATLRNLSAILLSAMLLTACGETTTETTENATQTDTVVKPVLETGEVANSPEFPEAKLTIGDVKGTAHGDSVKVSFNFNVANYELKNQTLDAETKQCNNSAQGQHIHFILDNKPYVALYEPKHEVTLAKNTEHYLLVFLARSYHESLKNPGAAAIYHFKVGSNGKLSKLEDPTTPMVFYSRPKGDYIGRDTKNLLFDYYIWNTTPSETGHKVKAAIKGEGMDTTLTFTNWKPYFLKNMPLGKSTITLTLVDADGNKVNGPETEVKREFTLSADEPLTAK